MNLSNTEAEQRKICDSFGADFLGYPPASLIGASPNIKTGEEPINGLRYFPEGNTNGWYIYAGETLPPDKEFFKPIHFEHLTNWYTPAIKYLGLPPGWRFLITASGYEDVWFDPTLLQSQGRDIF